MESQPRRHYLQQNMFPSTGGKSRDRLSASRLFLNTPLMIVTFPDSKCSRYSMLLHSNLYLLRLLNMDDTGESGAKNDS
jgi:hypothetical protein